MVLQSTVMPKLFLGLDERGERRQERVKIYLFVYDIFKEDLTDLGAQEMRVHGEM